MDIPSLGHYLALPIGFFALIIGLIATIAPEPMSKKFGIAVKDEALPYVISTGIRDIFMGLVILSLFYFSAWKTLGLCILLVTIVALADFLVVRKYGNKKVALVHLGSAFAAGLYGGWLFFISA